MDYRFGHVYIFGNKNCMNMKIIVFLMTVYTAPRLLCSEAADTDAIRLAGSKQDDRGRVEIYHNGQWGTICDDLWDNTDASVVCKSLGYREGITYSAAHFGSGNGPVWMDNVNCGPNEKAIQHCTHNGWGIANCDHDEDAGVRCFESDKDTITGLEMALVLTISIGLAVFVSGIVLMLILTKRKGCTVTLRCCIDVHDNSPSESGQPEPVTSHQDEVETRTRRRMEPQSSEDYEIISCELSTTRIYENLDKSQIETRSTRAYTGLEDELCGAVGYLNLSQNDSSNYEEITLKSLTLN